VGNGRGDVAHEDFRGHVREVVTEFGPRPEQKAWDAFAERVLFAAMWDRQHVESVQVDVPEKLGITDRSAFYDATGAVLKHARHAPVPGGRRGGDGAPASLGAGDL
jgi:glucose-6-phosphate 1-dehydrogenase